MLKRFLNDERGASISEYILIIALVSVACCGSYKLFGSQIKDLIVWTGRKVKDESQGFDS